MEHRLASFYFTGSSISLDLLRAGFLQQRVLDKGAFKDFTTKLPLPVTGFQPEPFFQVISKPPGAPGRERVELSLPVFRKDGLALSMEGLMDANEAGFKISNSGIMVLVEPTPHKF